MVYVMGLKITTSRFHSMAQPPYKISSKSTSISKVIGRTHKHTESDRQVICYAYFVFGKQAKNYEETYNATAIGEASLNKPRNRTIEV
jgi:hypothetical protein